MLLSWWVRAGTCCPSPILLGGPEYLFWGDGLARDTQGERDTLVAVVGSSG